MVSLARRKLGEDIDANSCSNFELAWALRCSAYGAMLFTVARSDGYIASSFPLLDVISVWMDFPVSFRVVR